MIRSKLLYIALCCASAFEAHAADVTFYFSGQVNGYSGASAPTIAAFPLGTSVSGSYSFNPATPDADPSPGTGDYIGAVTALTATIGGGSPVVLAGGGVNDIIVFNNSFLSQDGYSVTADIVGTPTPGFPMTRIGINLLPGNTSTFLSDALSLTPPLLSSFPATFESQLALQQGNQSVLFRLTFLSLVPEPTTLSLFGGGLCGMLLVRRRK